MFFAKIIQQDVRSDDAHRALLKTAEDQEESLANAGAAFADNMTDVVEDETPRHPDGGRVPRGPRGRVLANPEIATSARWVRDFKPNRPQAYAAACDLVLGRAAEGPQRVLDRARGAFPSEAKVAVKKEIASPDCLSDGLDVSTRIRSLTPATHARDSTQSTLID